MRYIKSYHWAVDADGMLKTRGATVNTVAPIVAGLVSAAHNGLAFVPKFSFAHTGIPAVSAMIDIDVAQFAETFVVVIVFRTDQ